MKKCIICKEELEEMWFDWDFEKCMECVLEALEVD
jgi:hypothetical protein